MSVTTNKPLDLALLAQQLAAAGIPAAALGTHGAIVHTYRADGQPLDLPQAAQAVVDAHDYQQGEAYQQKTADTNALTAFIADYASMRTRLATIQTKMDGIQGRADTLAGLTTWSGLALAPTTARLQNVMPALGQDLSTVATELHAIAVGLDNMLQALAVLYRRQGGA